MAAVVVAAGSVEEREGCENRWAGCRGWDRESSGGWCGEGRSRDRDVIEARTGAVVDCWSAESRESSVVVEVGLDCHRRWTRRWRATGEVTSAADGAQGLERWQQPGFWVREEEKEMGENEEKGGQQGERGQRRWKERWRWVEEMVAAEGWRTAGEGWKRLSNGRRLVACGSARVGSAGEEGWLCAAV
ncbi:hypothetical protein AMTR_s00027p00243620 [Amborella trichopoda]|uniref:Uncharacterized protein n=1 Tax=Amborella trichopoda TaxID=13333 RepID=W1PS31_AMBTC|nr:hypothetical protein AMTR_s00027p00243620 [Amborella trichopoda]